DLPRGWVLEGLARVAGDGVLETWSAAVRVPGDAAAGGSSEGGHVAAEVGVVVEGERHPVPVAVVWPLSVAWGVTSDGGRPRLTLSIRDEAGRPGRVWGEVIAPWLARAPQPFAVELGAGAAQDVHVDLPLAPRPATAPEPPERFGHAGVSL